jgi:hypothetical protein
MLLHTFYSIHSTLKTFLYIFISEDVPSLTPYRLKEGDVITMGSTELSVDLSTIDQENVSSST